MHNRNTGQRFHGRDPLDRAVMAVEHAAAEALAATQGAVAQAQVAAVTALLHNRFLRAIHLPDARTRNAVESELCRALFLLKFDREPDGDDDRTWCLFQNAMRSRTLDADEEALWGLEILRRERMEDRGCTVYKFERDGF